MAAAGTWFEEKETMWPGQRFSLKVTEKLHEEKSDFQHIEVYQTETYGRLLVLDGVIQLTERDEFAYQEMIVHIPMFAHANPERVLIVGGGDGGVAREVARHPGVKEIVMCELDKRVCETSKKFFSETMAVGFRDPRLNLLYMDAAEFMKSHRNEFDVIIVDSSDPVGPASTLYTSDFYANMYAALREGGIVCTQGECQFLHMELIAKVMADAKGLYPTVDYAYSSVPTYPSGQIGYILATKTADPTTLRVPKRPITETMKASLRYYTHDTHRSAFVLPAFAAKALEGVRATQALVADPAPAPKPAPAPVAAPAPAPVAAVKPKKGFFNARFFAGAAAGAAVAGAVAFALARSR